jgi:hypothetical protein
MEEADQLKINDAYRAIGRYGVAFSQLIATMRDLIATRLNGSEFRLDRSGRVWASSARPPHDGE